MIETRLHHETRDETNGYVIGQPQMLTTEEANELLSHVDGCDGEFWYYLRTGELKRAKYGQSELHTGKWIANEIARIKTRVA